MRLAKLEALASELVGDGKTPNLFFVSRVGVGVLMVTRDGEAAHGFWQSLPRNVETSLEDRRNGTLAAIEPLVAGETKLHHTYDNFARFVRGLR